jgi:hypothetical protein
LQAGMSTSDGFNVSATSYGMRSYGDPQMFPPSTAGDDYENFIVTAL